MKGVSSDSVSSRWLEADDMEYSRMLNNTTPSPSNSPSSSDDDELPISAGGIIGIIATVFVLLVAVVIFFVWRQRRKLSERKSRISKHNKTHITEYDIEKAAQLEQEKARKGFISLDENAELPEDEDDMDPAMRKKRITMVSTEITTPGEEVEGGWEFEVDLDDDGNASQIDSPPPIPSRQSLSPP